MLRKFIICSNILVSATFTSTCDKVKDAYKTQNCCHSGPASIFVFDFNLSSTDNTASRCLPNSCGTFRFNKPCAQTGGFPSVEDPQNPQRYQSVDSGCLTKSNSLYVHDDAARNIKRFDIFGTVPKEIITQSTVTSYDSDGLITNTTSDPFKGTTWGSNSIEDIVNVVSGELDDEIYVHIYDDTSKYQTIFKRLQPSTAFKQVVQDLNNGIFAQKIHHMVVQDNKMVVVGSKGYIARFLLSPSFTKDVTFGADGELILCDQVDPRDSDKRLISETQGDRCGSQKSVAIDEDGYIYVANKDAGQIAVISPNGVLVNTFSGNDVVDPNNPSVDRTLEQLEGVGYSCGQVCGKDESGEKYICFDTNYRSDPSTPSLTAYKRTFGCAGGLPECQDNADEFLMTQTHMVIFDKGNYRHSVHTISTECQFNIINVVNPPSNEANVVQPRIVFGDRTAYVSSSDPADPYIMGVSNDSPNEMVWLANGPYAGALCASDSDKLYYHCYFVNKDTSLPSCTDSRLPEDNEYESYRCHYIGSVGGFAATSLSGGKKGPEGAFQIENYLLVVDRGGRKINMYNTTAASSAFISSNSEMYTNVNLFDALTPIEDSRFGDITGVVYDNGLCQCNTYNLANMYVVDQNGKVYAFVFDTNTGSATYTHTLPEKWGTASGTFPPNLAGDSILKKPETLAMVQQVSNQCRLVATSEDQQSAWAYNPCTNKWDLNNIGTGSTFSTQGSFVADIEGIGIDPIHRILLTMDEDRGRVNLHHACSDAFLLDASRYWGSIAYIGGDTSPYSTLSSFGKITPSETVKTQQYGSHKSSDGVRTNGDYVAIADQKNNRYQIYSVWDINMATNFEYKHDVCAPKLVGVGLAFFQFTNLYVYEAHNSGDPEDYVILYNDNIMNVNLAGLMLDDSDSFADLTFSSCVVPAGGVWIGMEDFTRSVTHYASITNGVLKIGSQSQICEKSFGSGLSSGGDSVFLKFGDNVKEFVIEENKEQQAQRFDKNNVNLGHFEPTWSSKMPSVSPPPLKSPPPEIPPPSPPLGSPTNQWSHLNGVLKCQVKYDFPGFGLRQEIPATVPVSARRLSATVPVCATGSVAINEIHQKGEPEDWVELKNTGSVTCSLVGWTLYDQGIKDDAPAKDDKIFALTGSLTPGAFLFLEKNTNFAFGIGGGDTVYLKSPDDTETSLTDLNSDDDGATGLCNGLPTNTGAGTKGTSNFCICATGSVVINEIHQKGEPEDWVELKNTGSVTCSLVGWTLYDQGIKDDAPAKDDEIFAITGSLTPGAFLFLEKNTNFTFGIGGGDTVYLKSPDDTETSLTDLDSDDDGATGLCNGLSTNTGAGTKGTSNLCSLTPNMPSPPPMPSPPLGMTEVWTGLEVELCNAIAAAIGITPTYITGLAPTFALTAPVNTTALGYPFGVLPPTNADILIHQVTKTTRRATEYFGLQFIAPVLFGPTYIYDEGGIAVLEDIYGPSGTTPYTSFQDLDGTTICTGAGTVYTGPDGLLNQFALANGITINQLVLLDKDDAPAKLTDRSCVGLTGDRIGQLIPVMNSFGAIGLPLHIASDVQLGFQPLATVNRRNDANQQKLSDVATLVFDTLIEATELGKTKDDSWPATPVSNDIGTQYGLATNWREVALQKGGNWKEILERQASSGVPNLWSSKNKLTINGGAFTS